MSRTGAKRVVAVVPFNGSPLRYGFATNIDQAQSTQLGHAPVNNFASGFIFGANAPKPARARKRFASGIVSSFISAPSVLAARTAGWSIGKGKYRTGGTTPKGKTVYVTIAGIKYGWVMPNTTAQRIGGSLAQLGIREAQSTDKDIVFGASYPKPPTASRAIASSGGSSTLTTFYDPSVTLPAGWRGSGQQDPSVAL
ncbi:MAG: hypothetical protein HC781_22785 [Leptolyngbyaceae cyanobacterium CSU_1_4]|nr:hypothetical protein [Leptolyngbyaceae cyanobacterium CSU_1_4]